MCLLGGLGRKPAATDRGRGLPPWALEAVCSVRLVSLVTLFLLSVQLTGAWSQVPSGQMGSGNTAPSLPLLPRHVKLLGPPSSLRLPGDHSPAGKIPQPDRGPGARSQVLAEPVLLPDPGCPHPGGGWHEGRLQLSLNKEGRTVW